MNKTHSSRMLIALLLLCSVAVASAAERVRAGLWETTITIAGKPVVSSGCITEADAATMNGDAATIRAYLEKSSAKAGCTVKNVTVNGNQVVVTNVCRRAENVGTTTYKGDSSETVNSNGAKVQSRRVGACK